ncbi:carbamoyl-phosphate synthase large subunit, chloroplastic-like protein [Raphidocelis subcapitata]|uniref:Carbamoyl-phosphate synthase large subunit, chloroplastic-like protein n=1 Tax=Raphidocelis subcapitata TaxID=307507 RepID=A0A2V0NJS1_9CHLO|nr:carbamoyl-phosphate synthase large subunit, chloroplastic-like protein [Raphidocelis subcapitata]|eukprot:GBF87494.1 carbamoyl-phosphate synthase large subunit, chloroplastic-like protein [Raphidocelis subcapitata]
MGATAGAEAAVAPAASSPRAPLQLVGYDNFKRHNPRSDRFAVQRFHHVEFWCADATNTYKRFQHGLGMTLVGKSDQSTSNAAFASYVLQSNELVFTFTAPYSRVAPRSADGPPPPLPGYSQQAAYDFLNKHGLAVRAVGVLVADAADAYAKATASGGVGVLPPARLEDCEGGAGGGAVVSEVKLYGDVVLRFVSGDYATPGVGGGISYNMEEFKAQVEAGIDASMTDQVLVEKSLIGWKEFELEVMRDLNDNCMIVCSIENVDPMGVHTGDSITVAPAQTLTDKEYQRLRDASLAIIREMGVECGGSNVQMAVNPVDGEVMIIEMNPRVSRSSALASKATGFPIAKMAAKLAVGYTLDQIPNDITRKTPASFEPSIDYIVTKIPKFAFEKFPGTKAELTTQACEFDYSGTQACKSLRQEGYRVILLNSNPATIMTDPGMADRTYVGPMTPELVEQILDKERPDAILPTMGGQTGLNLAKTLAESGMLDKYGVELIGAKLPSIDRAEDRELFKQAMKRIGLNVPSSGTASNMEEALAIAAEIGSFPLIIRPAFTLGGTGGGISYNMEEFAPEAPRVPGLGVLFRGRFHEFAEFVAKDVGTVDSGLNSMVLASNNEMVLLPINEPTFGTKRKSQIQTYLEQNEGPGLQHLALKTNDIIATLREMSARSELGGFEFMPRPCEAYYRALPGRIGDALTPQQYAALEELGILADKDDQGVLLQIFTKPLGDRPTIFIEIIERVGCTREVPAPSGAAAGGAPGEGALGNAAARAAAGGAGDLVGRRADGVAVEQAAGCGGFGKGNFGALFLSIEEYERTLNV